MKTLTQYLNEVKARCEGASAGPWKAKPNEPDGESYMAAWVKRPREYGAIEFWITGGDELEGQLDPDAAFVGASRTDLPRLERWLREAVGHIKNLIRHGERFEKDADAFLARIEKEVGDG